MSEMKIPGIVYSLLLAIVAWAGTYFATGGAGGNYLWAPILLAALPIVLKTVAVYAGAQPKPSGAAMARGGVGFPVAVAVESKAKRLLLG